MFTTCPSIIISGTETGRSTGKLIWETPSVMDNSGQIVKPRLSPSSPALESEQPAGTYRISYSAEDNDDNRAMNCEFNLIVRGKDYIIANIHYVHLVSKFSVG